MDDVGLAHPSSETSSDVVLATVSLSIDGEVASLDADRDTARSFLTRLSSPTPVSLARQRP